MAWEGSTRRSRLPDDWDQRRAHVLNRDGHRCTIVLDDDTRCPRTATEVDHIQAGDDHTYPNLASICDDHHKAKTAAEAAAARRRTSRHRPPEPHPGLTN